MSDARIPLYIPFFLLCLSAQLLARVAGSNSPPFPFRFRLASLFMNYLFDFESIPRKRSSNYERKYIYTDRISKLGNPEISYNSFSLHHCVVVASNPISLTRHSTFFPFLFFSFPLSCSIFVNTEKPTLMTQLFSRISR